MGSYIDETTEASLDLDTRRQKHERRHARYLKQLRPATRSEMVRFVESYGATDIVHSDDLRHAPVTPVADGIAFNPGRMTLDVLTEVYERIHRVPRREHKLYDAVLHRVEADPAGLRKSDIVTLIGNCSEAGVRKALVQLEFDGKVIIKTERTRRGKGTPRKRYYASASVGDAVSFDHGLYNTLPDPASVNAL